MKENLEFYVKKNAGFYLIQYESWTTTLRVVNKVSDFANKLKITDKFYLLITPCRINRNFSASSPVFN